MSDTSSKPTNPKDSAAFGKRIAFSVIPFRVLAGLALALAEGAWKYGRHNYRPAGVRAMTYVDATLRHLFAYVEGQDIDPASGFHHVDKAIASLVVLRDGLYQGNVTDDRPPAIEGDFISEANAQYEALAVKMQADHGPPRAPFVRSTLRTDAPGIERVTTLQRSEPLCTCSAEGRPGFACICPIPHS